MQGGNGYSIPLFKNQRQKKYAVKKTKFFSRKFDYDNMVKFVKDIEKYNSEPGKEFIIKYKDFWLEEEKNILEKKNLIFNPIPDYDFRDLCKKLDFSENSENTMSVYSVSDNESMELNEFSSEDLTEKKNALDFSSFSSSSLTKIKPRKKYKNFFSEKNLTFINKKINFEEPLEPKISKFEEEYVVLKTLCWFKS